MDIDYAPPRPPPFVSYLLLFLQKKFLFEKLARPYNVIVYILPRNKKPGEGGKGRGRGGLGL